MKKLVPVAGLIIAGLTVAVAVTFAPLAAAQTVAPPVSCADATSAALGLQVKLDALLGSLDVKNLPAQKQNLAVLQGKLPAAQAAVAAAVAADNKAGLKVDSAATVAAKLALTTLTTQISTSTSAIAATEAGTAKLQLDLSLALGVKDRACTPVTPTPTPTTTTALPTSTGTPTSTVAPTTVPRTDVDCADLTQAQAQALLIKDPTDPNDLDLDHDGTACENGDPGTAQVVRVPTAVDTGLAA